MRFTFDLALRLGKTREELYESISLNELYEWQGYLLATQENNGKRT